MKDTEKLVELDFNTKAFREVNGTCKVKLTLSDGTVRTCKKLVMNRNRETNTKYPWAVLIATEYKDEKGSMVWRKFCISDNGEVWSSSKYEETYSYPELIGTATVLLPRDGVIEYLNKLC